MSFMHSGRPTRRQFLAGTTGLGLLAGLSACASSRSGSGESTSTVAAVGHIRSATAITEITGDGQKLVGVGVEYDTTIAANALTAESYSVPGRTITKVYPHMTAAIAATGTNGRYVIIELSPDDPTALLWGGPTQGASSTSTHPSVAASATSAGPVLGSTAHPAATPAVARVQQIGAIRTVSGQTYAATPEAVTTSEAVDPLVDLFTQHSFSDPATSETLPYNLYVPTELEPGRRYPLVLFMHDASVVGADVKGPLLQGLGAVCWAQPDDQQRHPCFVVAPQYPTVVVADDYQPTPLFDTTINLVNDLVKRYPIDPARLHATGQSMGAMMTLGMNIKHPTMFASSYVVAGQWPAEQAAPLAHKRLWFTVSQGDTKAYPMGNELLAVVEREGSTVTRATWDARWPQERFAREVAAVGTHATDVDFISFTQGTVPVPSHGLREHNGTWRIAYSIPGIRDWLLQ